MLMISQLSSSGVKDNKWRCTTLVRSCQKKQTMKTYFRFLYSADEVMILTELLKQGFPVIGVYRPHPSCRMHNTEICKENVLCFDSINVFSRRPHERVLVATLTNETHSCFTVCVFWQDFSQVVCAITVYSHLLTLAPELEVCEINSIALLICRHILSLHILSLHMWRRMAMSKSSCLQDFYTGLQEGSKTCAHQLSLNGLFGVVVVQHTLSNSQIVWLWFQVLHEVIYKYYDGGGCLRRELLVASIVLWAQLVLQICCISNLH